VFTTFALVEEGWLFPVLVMKHALFLIHLIFPISLTQVAVTLALQRHLKLLILDRVLAELLFLLFESYLSHFSILLIQIGCFRDRLNEDIL